MTVGRALADTTERLSAAGCEAPGVDAEFLLAHVVGVTRSQLALESSRKLAKDERRSLEPLVARRESREPLAYVLGEWGFRRLTLAVDGRVLVPRPETEIVVARCLARLGELEEPHVLDVGTGSGAIALAIADEYPRARVLGVDASPAALEVAGANAVRCGLAIELREWDLFRGLPEGPWDLVVSNPPYVLPGEIESLEPEVRDWEPRSALVGVGATEAVARGALDVLAPGRVLVLEIAADAGARSVALLTKLGYAEIAITPDLAVRDRVVEAVRAA